MTDYTSVTTAECITTRGKHDNGEQTAVAAIPVGDEYAVLAADINGTRSGILKVEDICVAGTEDAAENAVRYWRDQHPKGLEYGTLETIKLFIRGFLG